MYPVHFIKKKKKRVFRDKEIFHSPRESRGINLASRHFLPARERERERERICTVEAVGSRRISYSFTPNRSGNLRQTRQVLKVSGYNEKEEPLHGSIFFEPLTTVTRIIQYISFDPTFDTRKDIQAFLSPIYY